MSSIYRFPTSGRSTLWTTLLCVGGKNRRPRGLGARFSKDPVSKRYLILKSKSQEKKGVFWPLMKSTLFL